MLDAAGVDLDAPLDKINSTRRLSGLSIDLEIYWTNLDPKDFWAWPFGRKTKYIYKFSEVPRKKRSRRDQLRFDVVQTGQDGETRTVTRFTGILIQTTLHGQMGHYSVLHLIVTVMASFGAFAVVT